MSRARNDRTPKQPPNLPSANQLLATKRIRPTKRSDIAFQILILQLIQMPYHVSSSVFLFLRIVVIIIELFAFCPHQLPELQHFYMKILHCSFEIFIIQVQVRQDRTLLAFNQFSERLALCFSLPYTFFSNMLLLELLAS